MKPRTVAVWSLAALAVALGGAALVVLDPAKTHVLPPCWFHALTGLYCPGCGTTRAIHQLLHGNLEAAFAYNALAVVSLPFLLAGVAVPRLAARRGLPPPRLPGLAIWGIAIVVVLYGVLRNLPAEPFARLAPHAIRGVFSSP